MDNSESSAQGQISQAFSDFTWKITQSGLGNKWLSKYLDLKWAEKRKEAGVEGDLDRTVERVHRTLSGFGTTVEGRLPREFRSRELGYLLIEGTKEDAQIQWYDRIDGIELGEPMSAGIRHDTEYLEKVHDITEATAYGNKIPLHNILMHCGETFGGLNDEQNDTLAQTIKDYIFDEKGSIGTTFITAKVQNKDEPNQKIWYRWMPPVV